MAPKGAGCLGSQKLLETVRPVFYENLLKSDVLLQYHFSAPCNSWRLGTVGDSSLSFPRFDCV